MTAATAAPAGFSDDDLDRFEALANLLAPLLEIIQARRMTLGLLDAFVGPRISERILQGQVKRGDGDRIEAAFWYSDLRGFTALSESLPADAAAAAAERLLRELRRRRRGARRRDPAVHRRRDPDRVRDQAARGRGRRSATPRWTPRSTPSPRSPWSTTGGATPACREIEFGLGLHLGTRDARQRRRAQPARLQRRRPGGEQDRAHAVAAPRRPACRCCCRRSSPPASGARCARIGHFDLRGVAAVRRKCSRSGCDVAAPPARPQLENARFRLDRLLDELMPRRSIKDALISGICGKLADVTKKRVQ